MKRRQKYWDLLLRRMPSENQFTEETINGMLSVSPRIIIKNLCGTQLTECCFCRHIVMAAESLPEWIQKILLLLLLQSKKRMTNFSPVIYLNIIFLMKDLMNNIRMMNCSEKFSAYLQALPFLLHVSAYSVFHYLQQRNVPKRLAFAKYSVHL